MKSKKSEGSTKVLLNFIAEACMLKRVKRSGWSVLGIANAESVAEHSFSSAVIGYCLASMEKASVGKVILMTLFNDLHEARITDLHKMAQRYIQLQEAEDQAFGEQVLRLPKDMKDEMSQTRLEYRGQQTQESMIARDADILDCLIQAKEYQEHGFPEAVKFMKKAPQCLKTKSAQRLWQLAKKTSLNDWWLSLSEFKR
jgi:putative hydrolase of HD superfamily